MKSVRSLQRNAGLRHLFTARPAVHSPTLQSRAPLQQSFRTRPSLHHKTQNNSLSRSIHTQRSIVSSPSQALRALRRTRRPNTNGSGRRHNSSSATETQPSSLKERLKKMSREYGWTAVGVYLALSALDFPFCFLAVRLLGTDTIGHYEHVVVEGVKGFLKWPIQGSKMAEMVADGAVDEAAGGKEIEQVEQGKRRMLEEKGGEEVVYDHGYREAEKANRGENASIWTQLALAYAVHKSFIFVRVPLTAAVLPKVVKTLRGWGYNVGKIPSRKAVTAGGVNTKGSGVKSGN